MPFLKNSERKRLDVGAMGREVCHAMKEDAVQVRLGDEDVNVIFGLKRILDIES